MFVTFGACFSILQNHNFGFGMLSHFLFSHNWLASKQQLSTIKQFILYTNYTIFLMFILVVVMWNSNYRIVGKSTQFICVSILTPLFLFHRSSWYFSQNISFNFLICSPHLFVHFTGKIISFILVSLVQEW